MKKYNVGDTVYCVYSVVIGCGIEKIKIQRIESINSGIYITDTNNHHIPECNIFASLPQAKKEAIKRARGDFNHTVKCINSFEEDGSL